MMSIPSTAGHSTVSSAEVQRRLKALDSHWEIVDNTKLKRVFTFEDFAQALAFVNKVGEMAEAANHHPDIQILYNTVILELWTHDISGLSETDFDLAAKIDQIAASK
jgi:4a-hydroxytetrahydrobiopterin dehydratase